MSIWSRIRTVLFAALCFSASTVVAQNDFVPAAIPFLKVLHDTSFQKSTNQGAPFAVGKSPAGYTPAMIRTAYGFPTATNSGSGQTIAIVVAYGSPTLSHDLSAFSTRFGLPAANLTVLYPQGTPTVTDPLWALETTLDAEWAHAIAPGAKILLIVAKEATFDALLAGVDLAVKRGAREISMSWGASEFAAQTTMDFHFNASGVSFLAASGDAGYGATWPASSVGVTAVGGTTLLLNSSGARTAAETAWSGSGGGQSQYEIGTGAQSSWLNPGVRQIPDVSLNADPTTGYAVYTTTPYGGNSGWMVVGGTSAGTPIWAAITAIANSKRARSLDDLGAVLYALAPNRSSRGYTSNFFDVRSGCNGNAAVSLACADPGFDAVTGLGTPRGASLIPALQQY